MADCTSLPNLPIELIEESIIPNSALAWLLVSKKSNLLAIKYAVNDPVFLSDPISAVNKAILTKNYPLLNALLADKRYTAKYILSQVIKVCSTDKTANTILAKHCFDSDWLQVRILDRAEANGWIDLLDYVLAHKDLRTIPYESLQNASQALFDRAIQHPKFKWNDNLVANVITNKQLSDLSKLKILERPEISLPIVIENVEQEVMLDALLQDQRVQSSIEFQKLLWKRMIESKEHASVKYNVNQKIKKILDSNLLDPTINFNYPLRKIFKAPYFDQYLAKMLLDDDRIVLTLEPFTKNLIYSIISARSSPTFSERIKFVVNHRKYKREWFEPVITFILDQQSKLKTINNVDEVFRDTSLHQYLSEGIIQRFPQAIKKLQRMHPVYYNYDDNPDFYSDDE